MVENLFQNKKGEHLQYALAIIFLSITIFLLGFMTESNNITGFAVNEPSNAVVQNLREFKDVNSLGSLGVGNYFITSNGVVLWIDDSANPPVAKVKYVYESQKNKKIYIDAQGNIGYVLE